MKKIKKILIANRGEIVSRVIRSCEKMGIESVILYAQNDANLPYVIKAKEKFPLGTGSLSQTYLNQDKILLAAQNFQVDAIHPGYGFLSENSTFAKKIEEAGLIFIGPKFSTMKLMGDKMASKVKAQACGVPLVPGFHGVEQDLNTLLMEAKKIGFPLLIKASAGGGGKGMRLVENEKDFSFSLEQVKREALKSFSDDRVLLEKYILKPRHIEVQVFGDRQGNYVHLFERECSIQRRHQKIIEEAPSSFVDTNLRERLTSAALNLCKEIQYLGAGTIEFLVDENKNFYFLEMNTRLQVEHPVSEMITGTDLVSWQILVAQGDKIPLTQDKIKLDGHALECRIYAEDPDNGFLPTTGTIQKISADLDPTVRLECGYQEGNRVTIDYDPMLAKVIVHASERSLAIIAMEKALKHIYFSGLKTNRHFLGRVLQGKDFKAGNISTFYIPQHESELFSSPKYSNSILAWSLASTYLAPPFFSLEQQPEVSVWNSLRNFRILT